MSPRTPPDQPRASTAQVARNNASPPFDFDAVIERRGTGSIKWDRYAGRDLIPMWIADMDFRSPPAVIAALHQQVECGVFGYADPPATLGEVIATRLARDYGWCIEPSWIVWLPGLVPGLNLACLIAGERGDAVATLTPVYPPFLSAPRHAERDCIAVPLADDGVRWVIDFDRLEASLTPRTRALLFCNPHNPAGRVYSKAELEKVAEICLRHDLLICSDEVHCDLVLDGDKRHVPMATLAPEIAARTITLLAPSKSFNLPGLGVSFAVVSNDSLRQRLYRAKAGIVPDVNMLGFTAALAAYRDGDVWLAALLDYLRGNRDLVEQRIGAIPVLSLRHIEATYLAWIDARTTGMVEPQRFFEDAGVGLSDGKQFGAGGFVRLNFGCRRGLLQEALGRIERALHGR